MPIRPFTEPDFPGCQALIDSLPAWFGLPASNQAYLRDFRIHPTFCLHEGGHIVAAATLIQHLPECIELNFLAVRPQDHRRGLGRRMVDFVSDEARARGAKALMVKTLGPSRPDPHYARTRAFYAGIGFVPLFESTCFWGEGSPALVLVRMLGPSVAE